MKPDERHGRRLQCFARWFSAAWDADDATLESIAALSRRLDEGEMTAVDRRSTLDALDSILMDEVARRHR